LEKLGFVRRESLAPGRAIPYSLGCCDRKEGDIRMPNSRFDVVGVGSAIVDIIARCDDAFLEAYGLPKGHMRLVGASEAERLYGQMGPAVEVSGGSAANTCAGVASLGGRAGFMGRVANDPFGGIFAHDIRSIGVNFENPPASDGAPTARCLILVTPDGERTMSTFLGAAAEFSSDELRQDLIESARITYLEGYLFDPPAAKTAFHEAACIAAAAKRKVALSLSDAFCVERHRAAFRSFIKGGVDIVFCNESEALALYETSSLDDACAALRQECELAVVTRGEHGSRILTVDESIDIAVDPIDHIVDTTGAGDLYAAGFLFGFSTGRDLRACGRLASIAAAEVVSHIGPRPEVSLSWLAERKGAL
jgi:sugar/nucleoside kinase (ribokinase family)